MLEIGAIYYGLFTLNEFETKNKYLIVFHLYEDTCLLTTFTTSQERSGSLNPVHGHNPQVRPYKSHVFKQGVEIGIEPDTLARFAFPKDTSVVPDYGFAKKTTKEILSSVRNLKKVCQLDTSEYIELMYTLIHSKGTPKGIKEVFETKLEELMSQVQE